MSKKINFVIDSLHIGGAEKVLVELVNELSSEYEVNLFSIYDGPLSSNLNCKVNYKFIIANSSQKGFFLRLLGLIKRMFFMRFPNLFLHQKQLEAWPLIAFLENQSIKVVENYSGVNKKIAWIHTDIRKQNKRFRHHKRVYEKFEQLVFSSNSAFESFNYLYGDLKGVNCSVIYNGLDYSQIKHLSEDKTQLIPDEGYSVSVGRLCDAKDYLGLLSSLRLAYQNGYLLNHYIIGDGPDKELILKKIDELNLSEHVFLLGALSNPYPYIKNAKLFVHNARWEGFGLVIIESTILNTLAIVRRNGATEEICTFLDAGYMFDSEDELVALLLEAETLPLNNYSEKYKKLTYHTMKNKLLEVIYD